jgi:hypothetical protein
MWGNHVIQIVIFQWVLEGKRSEDPWPGTLLSFSCWDVWGLCEGTHPP